MNKYTAVSCQMHSELELIIMHKQSLKIKLGDGYDNQEILITPYNIVTRNKSEFLLAKNSLGEFMEIRLDRILSFQIRNQDSFIQRFK